MSILDFFGNKRRSKNDAVSGAQETPPQVTQERFYAAVSTLLSAGEPLRLADGKWAIPTGVLDLVFDPLALPGYVVIVSEVHGSDFTPERYHELVRLVNDHQHMIPSVTSAVIRSEDNDDIWIRMVGMVPMFWGYTDAQLTELVREVAAVMMRFSAVFQFGEGTETK